MNCHAQNISHQNTIASIADGYTITFAELEQYVHDYKYTYRYRKYPTEPFEKALDDLIVDQLKRIDFFDLGLNRSTESLPRIKRSINEELVIRYYKTQFYGRYVNEDSMQNAYKEMGREVVYQQIVLAKPKNASRKDTDSLKLLASTIRMRVRKGEDWVKLATQYSQDLESRSGNTLQSVNWKMSLANDLNDAVFHLPVNDVRILDSGESFHIVKIVRINKIDVQPYAKVKEDIRKALDERYAEFSYEEFDRAKKGLIDEGKVKWNPKALRQLVQWSNIPGFYQTSYADTLRDAISHGRNTVILKYSNVQVDLKEYLRFLNAVLTWGDFVSVNQDKVKKFVLEAVRTSMIVDKAIKLGLEKDVFTPATTTPVLRSGIVWLYDRHEIEERIPPATEKALKEFYQANRDSLYYQLAKVNIYAAVDSTRNVIEGMKEKLNQNVPFERLAPEILVKTYIRKRGGTLATFAGDEPPFLAEPAFKLKLNEVAGPIEYLDPAKGKRYALIKCVGTREEKQLSYDDVKKTIADDFAKYHRERIAQSVRERLKRKYSVTIYRDVLQKLFSSIGIIPQ
jgi:hypothetical protein